MVRMCGFFAFLRCGMAYFDAKKVPLALTCIIRSKVLAGKSSTFDMLIALALFTSTSMPPNASTVFWIASLTLFSSLMSHYTARHLPPRLSISFWAVKIVPSSLGCGVTVFARIAIFAPSFAARLAISKPIPLDAPVITIVLPFKVPSPC
jgi:hypothetical protein